MNKLKPTKQDLRKFDRACDLLAELMDKGFHLYACGSGCLNLLNGDSHDSAVGGTVMARKDRVVAFRYLKSCGGGDW